LPELQHDPFAFPDTGRAFWLRSRQARSWKPACRHFFSYSHADETLGDQLEVQFTMLRRAALMAGMSSRETRAIVIGI
jgi:hypothetical protein